MKRIRYTSIFVLLSFFLFSISTAVFAEANVSIFDSLSGGEENPVLSQAGVNLSISGSPNAAVAFNSDQHPNPCNDSGCDNDLRLDQGIVMIVREDSTAPGTQNDRGAGGTLTFNFNTPVTISSFEILDNEKGASYSINGGGSVGIPNGSNGSLQFVAVNASNVSQLVVTFSGSGAVDDLSFSVPSSGCTYTQGYWKNHPEDWPVNSLTIGGQSYTKDSLIGVLKTPVKGNGVIQLAHQLIAAKLNIANGANGSVVAGAIADADNLIASAGGLGGSLKTKDTSSLNDILTAYNEGNSGPGHCD